MRKGLIGNHSETIKAAAAGGTLVEVTNVEICRSDADGELKLVVDAGDGDNINPQNKDLHLDTLQAREAALGDDAGYGGLVLEVVGLDLETTRTVQEGFESAGGAV